MTPYHWIGLAVVALLTYGIGYLLGMKRVVNQWAAHELHRLDPAYDDSDLAFWQVIKEIADEAKARQADQDPVRAAWLAQYNEAYKVKQ